MLTETRLMCREAYHVVGEKTYSKIEWIEVKIIWPDDLEPSHSSGYSDWRLMPKRMARSKELPPRTTGTGPIFNDLE